MAERDPIKAHARNARAQRRAGVDWVCPSCREERRGYAKANDVCFACDRIAHGRLPYEWNHVFGERNNDAKLARPINDHRAALSVAQYDWPSEVRENPEGSPVIAAAGMRLGGRDEIRYILDRDTSGEMLLELDKWLRVRLGPKWWVGSPIEKYAPVQEGKRKHGE